MQIRSAKLGDLYSLMKKELEGIYPEQELRNLIHILLSHISGYTRSEIILRKDEELTESKIHFLQRAVKGLKKHEPVQYITGLAHFHGYEFKVDPSVLIPRPETEELVQWICSDQKDKSVSILDIGTGSGCIAVTLKKKLPSATLTAIDISEEALVVARENASILGADVKFEKIDILNAAEREALPVHDIIVSNPPYVTPADRKRMLRNVTDHEPADALFVEEDPLIFYREIIKFSEDHLIGGGSLYFETNELYARELSRMMKANGFNDVVIRRDMQGKERMVKGVRC